MKSAQNAIDVYHLTLNYRANTVLWDLNFEVSRGELVGIIGPNGAGKSSLIKALLGFVKPLSGKILFHGKSFKEMRRRIAYVPQREGIDWEFPITVFDVVLMGCYPRLRGLKWYRREDRRVARQMLERLEMGHLASRQISELSGGQQRRLFLARALMQDAEIFFLDEPFAGIDETTESAIVDILKELRAKGKTLLVVHHDLSTVEEYFDSVLILKTALIAYGRVSEVFIPAHLNRAFGRQVALFDEAIHLAHLKKTGLI